MVGVVGGGLEARVSQSLAYIIMISSRGRMVSDDVCWIVGWLDMVGWLVGARFNYFHRTPTVDFSIVELKTDSIVRIKTRSKYHHTL